MKNYDDIINLSRPKSNHPHLGVDSRASQFSPFAALTGYDSAVKETARLTDKKIDIDDGLRDSLNNKLNYIEKNIKKRYEIEITYFVKDLKKDGGKYETKKGIIKRIDNVNEIIKFDDNVIISMNDILSITGDLFKTLEFEDF